MGIALDSFCNQLLVPQLSVFDLLTMDCGMDSFRLEVIECIHHVVIEWHDVIEWYQRELFMEELLPLL